MGCKRKGDLTQREERFCWLYVMGDESGKSIKPIDIIKQSGYKAKSTQNCYHEYKRILERSIIQRRIDELVKQRDKEFLVDRKFVIEELRKIAEAEKDSAQKVKALELLGKHLGLFEERISISKDRHAQIADDVWKKREKQIMANEQERIEAIKLGIIAEQEEMKNEAEIQD